MGHYNNILFSKLNKLNSSFLLQNAITLTLFLLLYFLSIEQISAQTTSICSNDCFTFKGKIDYKAIGNSMNYAEDRSNCGQKPNSSATLTLPAGASVYKAYLIWSGSGAIDNSVSLNGQQISAQRTFTNNTNGDIFFAAYADATSLVQGSGTYTVSDLQWSNSDRICYYNAAYGAWSLVVVYQDPNTSKICEIQLCMDKFRFTFPAGTYWSDINCIQAPINCPSNAKMTLIVFEGDAYKGEWFGIGGQDYSWGGIIDPPNAAGLGNNFRGQTAPNLDIITYNVSDRVNGNTSSLRYGITAYTGNTTWGTATEGLFDFAKILKYDARSTVGATCDDGNALTENDVVLSDGCTCAGKIDPCKQGPDTDGDGIKDNCDCDDDNDGILDTDEMGISLKNGDFSQDGTSWVSYNTTFFNNSAIFKADDDNPSSPDGYFEQTVTGLSCRNQIELTFDATRFINSGLHNNHIYVSLNGILYLEITNPGNASSIQHAVKAMNGATVNVSSFPSDIPQQIKLTIPYSAVNNNTATLRFLAQNCWGCASSIADFKIDNITISECDFDNDGIVNRLDNDSDNDGCPDAVEGSGNYTLSNLNTNNRLTLPISACGLPGSTPQAIGTSQNSTVKDPDCVPKGSIGDMTYCDNNGNGIIDNGDTPQSGVQVTLCNANNVVITTVTTDTQGKYLFPNLTAGIYIVKFPTTITGGKTITTNNPITVNLGTGQNYLDADGGYKPPIPTCPDGNPKKTPGTACNDNNPNTNNDVIQADGCSCVGTVILKGSIGDMTYCDNNANGIMDNGDTPQSGVQVTLCNANNVVITTVTTDAQGKYIFPNLTQGIYVVKFPATITGGKTITTNNPIAVNLSAGQNYLDADAGYKLDCTTSLVNATINGASTICPNTTTLLSASGGTSYKWNTGVVAPSITVGIGTYTVTVSNTIGCTKILSKTIGTASTIITVNNCPTNINLVANANNCAIATWIAPVFTANCGTPKVISNYNPGYCFPVGTSTVTYSATLNGASRTCSFTVTVIAPPKGSIGDYVFKDNNCNGIQDAGDSPLSGVFIQLKNNNGIIVNTAISGTNGQYLFANLIAGNYQVCFSSPSGCTTTTKNVTGSDANNDSDIDNNGNSGIITLNAGQNINTIDAGFKPIDNAILGDRVWEDSNGNGIQDSGEIGIPNITVFLTGTSISGTSINKSTITNAVGQYLFSNLPAGNYRVIFSIPSTYIVTTKDRGTNDNNDSDVEIGTNMTGFYTLTAGQSNLSVDAGLYRPACVGDFIFIDANKDGIQDIGEIGYSNIPVILSGYTNTGTPITLITMTSQNGNYKFNNVPPGAYYIELVIPNGFTLTQADKGIDDAKDSDIDPSTGKSVYVSVTSGQNYLLLDAGIYNKFNNSCSGDIIPPVFSNIPNNLTIECGATFNMPLPSVSDNCSATSNIQLNFTDTETNGTCPIKKTITRTWKATDQSGNTTTVSRTITVIDTKAPIITGTPNDITIQCGQSIPLAPGYGVNGVQAFDDCEGNITNKVTFSEVIFAGTCVSNTTSNGKSKMVCTWTIKDVCGNISSKPWNITINSSASTSRSNNNNDDNDNIDNIEIFPNPNNGNFVVKVSDLFINELSIFDVSGKKVYQKVLNQHQQLINVDLSELNLGMYFLYLNTPEKRITKKIIVN